MTADVVREQEPPPKDVKNDDPDDFIEEIDSTDDVQEVNGQRDEPTTNSSVKLTPKHPRPVKVSTSKIFEPETVKRRQNLNQKGTPKPVAPILPNPSSSPKITQNLPLNRQMLFRNVSPPNTSSSSERKTSPEQILTKAESKQAIQLSENVSLVQNGVNVIPVQLPRNVASIRQCVCTCTCGANQPGTLLRNPQNSVQVITMDQFTGKTKQVISQMVPDHVQSSVPFQNSISNQFSELQKRKYPYMYTAEKLQHPKKTKNNFNPTPVSIHTIHQSPGSHQSKYLSSLLPGLPASNQQQLIHSKNRMISQQQQQQIHQSKLSQQQQIIYHPKSVQVPASSSSILTAQQQEQKQQIPKASTSSTSITTATITVSLPKQQDFKENQESERARTKESSPEINVTEVDDIKEEEIENKQNVKTSHAPQTDILFKAIEALQKEEEAQKIKTESQEQPAQGKNGVVSPEIQPPKPTEVAIKIEGNEQEEINTESINNIIEPTRSIQNSEGKKETVVHDLETIEFIRSFCFKDIFNKMTEEEKHARALHLIRKKAVVFIDVRSNMRGTEFDESRRFHCTFCPLTIKTQRKFRNAEDLYRHHCQHLRYRPFKCPVEDCQATYYRRDHLHTHVVRHHPWKSFSPERLTGFKKQQEFIGATSNFVMPTSEQQQQQNQQRAAAYHHYRLNSMPTLLDSVQKNELSLQNDINTIS